MRWLELKIPPLLIVLGFGLAMYGASWSLPVTNFEMPGRPYVSLAFAILGVATVASGVIAFRSKKTTVDPRFPDKASSVVTIGIYRITRNPMYLGMLFLLTAWALFLANFIVIILLAGFVVYMTLFQIKPEERILRSKFGAEYEEFLSRVRRWI
ncbi:MAG TPA: isoprenylcysteine carboxylmethyltransferase family protein [Pyrinomonadaceae bacterium]|nr:isoprenylcysteine carboxylmethyltransferase family protein [Pyrinomonadaceae bacterium]